MDKHREVALKETFLERRFWSSIYFFLFVSTLLYSYGTNLVSPFHNNFVTIAYVVCLLGVFVATFKRTGIDRSPLIYLGLIPIVYLGIYMGVYFAGAKDSVIWMPDSYRVHLNHSQSLMMNWDFLKLPTTLDERYLSFHIISAFIFSLFGVNVYSGGIILFIGKILTGILIFKFARKLFNEQIAATSVLIYTLVPTVLYYSIVFYKEVYVHLFVILVYYFAHSLFFENRVRSILPLLGSLLLLFNERFYLASFFIITFILLSLFHMKGRMRTLAVTFSLLSSIGIFYIFKTDILNLNSWRNSYNSYPDINKRWNLEIPFYLAFIKILFTPFFTINKFNLFNTFSYLLIWGSFINQAVIAMMVSGAVRFIKKDPKIIILIFTPFLCFLFLFAYVGPAQGRLRDSFYPIISIFAGYFIMELARMRKLKKSI